MTRARSSGATSKLLRYEQRQMTGGDFGMSVLAESPIDGGRPFREVVPYEVELNAPDRIPVVADQLVPDRIPFTDVRIPGGEGVTVEGPFDVIANRPLLLEGEVDHGLLEYLVIN